MICLVIESNNETVYAQVITTGFKLSFTKSTGQATCIENGETCWVHSARDLPKKHKAILLKLYERYNSAGGDEKYKLLNDEKNSLIFVGEYYKTDNI